MHSLIRKKIAVFAIIVLLINSLFCTGINAATSKDAINNKNANYEAAKKMYIDWFHKSFDSQYKVFLSSISNADYKDINSGWSVMRPENTKLIIGASGVVHCGAVTDGYDFGYDIIGYGGVIDEQIKEWIPKINKKYDRIIYYGGTNTLNLCLSIEGEYSFQKVKEEIVFVMSDVIDNLLKPDGTFKYVNVKELESTGVDDFQFVSRFNDLASKLNFAIKYTGVECYTIPFKLDSKYAVDRGHYSNIAVYRDLLD